MKEKLLYLVMKYKKVIIFIIVFILLITAVMYLTRTTFSLNIMVTPNDSLITVSNGSEIYTSKGNFNKKLKKEIYKLKIEKEGYITEEREIKLDKNTKVVLTLFKSYISELEKSYTPIKISPMFSTSGFKNGKIYGVNRKNGNLIMFEDNKETVVYNGEIEDYEIKGNTAVILDSFNLGEIIVLNLNNLSLKRISQKLLAPIISVSLSDDEKNIYYLSEFGIDNKVSNLNSISVDGSNYKKINETESQSVEFLKSNTLILFEETHDIDKNVINFYDLDKNLVTLSKLTSSYKISPDKNYILLHKSKNVEIIDTFEFKSRSKNIEQSSRSVWKDNDTAVLFRNNTGNSYYSILKTDTFETTPFQILLENSSILNVFGFVENKLFAQDYKEKIFSIQIPNY